MNRSGSYGPLARRVGTVVQAAPSNPGCTICSVASCQNAGKAAFHLSGGGLPLMCSRQATTFVGTTALPSGPAHNLIAIRRWLWGCLALVLRVSGVRPPFERHQACQTWLGWWSRGEGRNARTFLAFKYLVCPLAPGFTYLSLCVPCFGGAGSHFDVSLRWATGTELAEISPNVAKRNMNKELCTMSPSDPTTTQPSPQWGARPCFDGWRGWQGWGIRHCLSVCH